MDGPYPPGRPEGGKGRGRPNTPPARLPLASRWARTCRAVPSGLLSQAPDVYPETGRAWAGGVPEAGGRRRAGKLRANFRPPSRFPGRVRLALPWAWARPGARGRVFLPSRPPARPGACRGRGQTVARGTAKRLRPAVTRPRGGTLQARGSTRGGGRGSVPGLAPGASRASGGAGGGPLTGPPWRIFSGPPGGEPPRLGHTFLAFRTASRRHVPGKGG